MSRCRAQLLRHGAFTRSGIKAANENGIIHILLDSGSNGSVERIPLEGKRGNEELIGANV